MRVNIELYKNIFYYGLIPITIIILAIIVKIGLIDRKKDPQKRVLTGLKLIGLLFSIYLVYTFILSLNELIFLRQFNSLRVSKKSIIKWIILPIIPAIILFIIGNKYQKLKQKGEKENEELSSN